MPLPSGPPMSLSQALAEFSKPATSGLSALAGITAYRGTTPVTLPAANAIKLSDLYGLGPHAAAVTVTVAPASVDVTPTLGAAWSQAFTASITPAGAATWTWATGVGWPAWATLSGTGTTGTVTIADPKQVPAGENNINFRVEAVHGGVTDDEYVGLKIRRTAPVVTVSPPSAAVTITPGASYVGTFTVSGADTYTLGLLSAIGTVNTSVSGDQLAVVVPDTKWLSVGPNPIIIDITGETGAAYSDPVMLNITLTRPAIGLTLPKPADLSVTEGHSWNAPPIAPTVTNASGTWTVAWSVSGLTGATVSVSGAVSGTAPAGSAGAHTITVTCTVTDGAASASASTSFVLTVAAPPATLTPVVTLPTLWAQNTSGVSSPLPHWYMYIVVPNPDGSITYKNGAGATVTTAPGLWHSGGTQDGTVSPKGDNILIRSDNIPSPWRYTFTYTKGTTSLPSGTFVVKLP